MKLILNKKYNKFFESNGIKFENNDNMIEITLNSFDKEKEFDYYKLKKNENIHTVSNKFSIPETMITKYNPNVTIESGVTIFIPTIYGKRYKVMPCDTIESISRNQNVSIKNIKEKNNIDYVFAGQIIIL